MIKKITTMLLIITMTFGMYGCKKEDKSAKNDSLTDKYSQTMLVVPESIKLEEGFLDEYESLTKVTLPDGYENDIENITNQIASFAENKKVKCIIIASDEEGMLPVFEKIREKNSTVITVAAGIEEMQIEEKMNDVSVDKSISMGFNPTDQDNPKNAVQMASAMGAETFVNYINSDMKDNLSIIEKNKELKFECKKAGIKYEEVNIDEKYKNSIEKFVEQDLKQKINSSSNNINVYASDAEIEKDVVKAAINTGAMVSNVHTLDSTALYCDIFDIKVPDTEYIDYSELNRKISENLKQRNVEGRFAGTEIPEKVFCIEAAIETTNKIFEKSGDEYGVFKEMKSNVKKKTGILAEYTKVRYDNNFFRAVEMYPILY